MEFLNRLAGRRTWDTRDEFCASVCFMSAGVLFQGRIHGPSARLAHCGSFHLLHRCLAVKTALGIPSFHSVFPFSPERKSFSSVAASLLNASAEVLLVC